MTEETIDIQRERAESDARTYGYHLNQDPVFLKGLLEGLNKNEERYGYPSCPCRLAAGKFEFDRDIVCPCDYRDPDVAEFGACYCGLYVRKDVYEGKTGLQPVPERRPIEKQSRAYRPKSKEPNATAISNDSQKTEKGDDTETKLKFWYCKQCGYVVFRDTPPYVCPICKAKKELFERIEGQIHFFG